MNRKRRRLAFVAVLAVKSGPWMMIIDSGRKGVGSGRGLEVTGETLGSDPNPQAKAGIYLMEFYSFIQQRATEHLLSGQAPSELREYSKEQIPLCLPRA